MIDSNILVADTSGYDIRQLRKCDLQSYMRGGGSITKKNLRKKQCFFLLQISLMFQAAEPKSLLIKSIFSFVKVRFISQN